MGCTGNHPFPMGLRMLPVCCGCNHVAVSTRLTGRFPTRVCGWIPRSGTAFPVSVDSAILPSSRCPCTLAVHISGLVGVVAVVGWRCFTGGVQGVSPLGLMGGKEPAVQNQGQGSPDRRTRLARGDEAGWWALQTLGRNWILFLVPWGAIGRLRAGRHLDLHAKHSLYLEYGPQWVEVEARSPDRRPHRH